MEIDEAVKHLEFSKKSYQNLIDNDTRNGEIIGKDTTGTWKANTSLATVYQTMRDTMVVAIRSLEAWEKVKVEINAEIKYLNEPALVGDNKDVEVLELEWVLEVIDKQLKGGTEMKYKYEMCHCSKCGKLTRWCKECPGGTWYCMRCVEVEE